MSKLACKLFPEVSDGKQALTFSLSFSNVEFSAALNRKGGPHMEPDFGAPDYSLRYEKEIRGDILLFHCRGGFSLVNHGLLDSIIEQIKSAPERKVVLDLGGIRFMDSVGMGTIAAILKHTMAHQMDLVLVSNDIVGKLLATSGLSRVIRVTSSLEEAIGKAAP